MSSPLTIIPLAIRKPPINRKIIGLAKALKASVTETTPNITQSVGPIRDVTGMGTGSQIHQKATNVTIARSLWASTESPAIGIRYAFCDQKMILVPVEIP